MPLPVASVVFFLFTCLNGRLKEALFAVFAPLDPEGETSVTLLVASSLVLTASQELYSRENDLLGVRVLESPEFPNLPSSSSSLNVRVLTLVNSLKEANNSN